MINFKLIAPAALALGVALTAGGANAGSLTGGAGFTNINPVGGFGGNERCLVGTAASNGATCGAGGTFGGTESIMSILSREVGGTGVTRIQDFDGSAPFGGGGSALGPQTSANHNVLDQIWGTGGKGVTVRATARYLGAGVETLGYIEGTTPLASNSDASLAANFHSVLPLLSPPNQLQTNVAVPSDHGDIKPISSSFVSFSVAGNLFRFAIITDLPPTTGDANWTSFQGLGDGTGGDPQLGDHMVAFQDDNNPLHFFLAFDDQQGNVPADLDFNDTVFEVVFGVPEPASLALFGVGLLGLGAVARRHKASKTA